MGLVASHTSSKGRHGYGTEYKLVLPERIGRARASPEWWSQIVQMKTEHEKHENQTSIFASPSTINRKKTARGGRSFTNMFNAFITSTRDVSWEKFFGVQSKEIFCLSWKKKKKQTLAND
jgi:hypothetical protein